MPKQWSIFKSCMFFTLLSVLIAILLFYLPDLIIPKLTNCTSPETVARYIEPGTPIDPECSQAASTRGQIKSTSFILTIFLLPLIVSIITTYQAIKYNKRLAVLLPALNIFLYFLALSLLEIFYYKPWINSAAYSLNSHYHIFALWIIIPLGSFSGIIIYAKTISSIGKKGIER